MEAAPAAAGQQIVSRRGLHPNSGQVALSLARSRQDGHVLDILVQSRRNAKAAKRFFRKLLKGLQYVPRVIITDKLRSCAAAKRDSLPGVEHRQSRYQQPCRGLAPADMTRTTDAALQVSPSRAAFPLRWLRVFILS
jgi:DDE domain